MRLFNFFRSPEQRLRKKLRTDYKNAVRKAHKKSNNGSGFTAWEMFVETVNGHKEYVAKRSLELGVDLGVMSQIVDEEAKAARRKYFKEKNSV